jgi:hypothetical protein
LVPTPFMMLTYASLLGVIAGELRDELLKAVTFGVDTDGRGDGLDVFGRGLLVAGEVQQEGCSLPARLRRRLIARKICGDSEHVHARHSSSLDVAGDGDGNHCLAGLLADHAEEVQRSGGGGIETQSEGVENQRASAAS